MKGRKIVWAAAALLLLAAALAATLLQRRINRGLAEAFPPDGLAAGLGVQAREVHASLWRGVMEWKGLRVAQPAGFGTGVLFRVKQANLSVRYGALGRGRIRLNEVTARDALLVLVRNADGRWNLGPAGPALGRPGAGGSGPPAGVPGAEDRPDKPRKADWPAIEIEKLAADLTIRVLDRRAAPTGGETRIRLQVAGTNLATHGAAGDMRDWGVLAAEGEVDSGGRVAPLRFTARVAPGAAEDAVSFDLTGELRNMDREWIRPLLGRYGEWADRIEEASAVADLSVRDGVFDESRSRVTLQLKNVRMSGRVIPLWEAPLPVHGRLEKPELRTEEALAALGAQILMLELQKQLTR